MDEILNESIDGSGYNPEFGLLGSNKATETSIKLFPRDCTEFVNKVQKIIKKTGSLIEVMVLETVLLRSAGKIGNGDPVVSPGFTEGLKGCLIE